MLIVFHMPPHSQISRTGVSSPRASLLLAKSHVNGVHSYADSIVNLRNIFLYLFSLSKTVNFL